MNTPMKLGKLPPKKDPRTLMLARYLPDTALPIVPGEVDWAQSNWVPKFGMFANDVYGDCTCASLAHAIQSWNGNVNKSVTLKDADVLKAYSAISGFNPSDPSTDRGAYCIDALNYLRKTGIGGHKCAAYAKIVTTHHAMLRATMWLFGGAYIGAVLYDDIWGAPVWDAPKPSAVIAGGHAMFVVRYSKNQLAVVTWGGLQPVTWRWLDRCCDEAYAVLSEDALDAAGRSVAGFDVAALRNDLGLVTK